MRKVNYPKLTETQGIQFLGHSNWTICSLSSQLCLEIFPTFDFHTPEPISLLPQEK